MMATTSNIFQNIKIHGLKKTVHLIIYKVFHKTVGYTCLNMIVLEKAQLSERDPIDVKEHYFKLATEEDLRKMQELGEYEITDYDVHAFESGELCLLHFYKNELTGYTWAHPYQTPEILDGIKVQIPEYMIYNYKGFTHPTFRGKGFQALRYFLIFSMFEDQHKTCLVGYVEVTNWSSRKGQKKGGYHKIGRISYIRIGKTKIVKVSRQISAIPVGLADFNCKLFNFYVIRNR